MELVVFVAWGLVATGAAVKESRPGDSETLLLMLLLLKTSGPRMVTKSKLTSCALGPGPGALGRAPGPGPRGPLGRGPGQGPGRQAPGPGLWALGQGPWALGPRSRAPGLGR